MITVQHWSSVSVTRSLLQETCLCGLARLERSYFLGLDDGELMLWVGLRPKSLLQSVQRRNGHRGHCRDGVLVVVLKYIFYPRDAMRRAGLCDGDVSVCLSVTAGIVSERKQLASWFLHHLIAPWFNSLARYDSSKNSQGVTLREGDLWECGGFELRTGDFAIFRPISRRISETVQYTTKVTIEH